MTGGKLRDTSSVQWNFPICVVAVDGKHVSVVCPNNTGSTYYNYKGGFSTVLIVVVDGEYRLSGSPWKARERRQIPLLSAPLI